MLNIEVVQQVGTEEDERITDSHIDSVIKNCEWHILPNNSLTICVLTLVNGFTVTGESVCANPDDFNIEIGEDLSYHDARSKVWQFETYLMKQRLHEADKMILDDLYSIQELTCTGSDFKWVTQAQSNKSTLARKACDDIIMNKIDVRARVTQKGRVVYPAREV